MELGAHVHYKGRVQLPAKPARSVECVGFALRGSLDRLPIFKIG